MQTNQAAEASWSIISRTRKFIGILNHEYGAVSMAIDFNDFYQQSTQVLWAEQTLAVLRQRVATFSDHQSRLKRFCHEWHQTTLQLSEQLRQRVDELNSRIAPWMPQENSPHLTIVSAADETVS